jgi:dTDP-4-dehydrorhamnose 3,5-epimerase
VRVRERMNSNRLLNLGPVKGVQIEVLAYHSDLRGGLIANSREEIGLSTVPFNTAELFFTISKKNVFRGIHLQSSPHEASKRVSIVCGQIEDFLVDLRPKSPTFLNVQITSLSEESPQALVIPPGVGHAYVVKSEKSIVSYQYSHAFCPQCDLGVKGDALDFIDDFNLSSYVISDRDSNLPSLENFDFSGINRSSHQ